MWDVVSLVLFATKKCDVRVRLPSALQEFCCCLGTCSLIHHWLCTLWTAFTNDLTWILLALVAPFSRGYVPAFVGEYVPFFSPRGFWGFRIRQIHLKSVPAHNRPKQGLRLVIIIIVFCPGKLFGCPVYFFHDLGRIHGSLFRIPRLDRAISHNSLCSLLCLFFSFFSLIQCYLCLPNLGLGTVLLSVGLGTYTALCHLTTSGPCLPRRTPLHKF